MNEIKCLNHAIKPESEYKKDGQGDCSICIPHPDNIHCSAYQPVKITIFGFEVYDNTNISSLSKDKPRGNTINQME
jgi:hypothetical protein